MANSLRRAKKATAKKTASAQPPTTSPDEAVPATVPAPAGEPAPAFFELPKEPDQVIALDVPLADISANPFNDRDLGDVSGLAASIEKDGLLQDVAVMHTAEFAEHYPDAAAEIMTKYVLAFGERRWRAHIALGVETINAILRDDVAPKIRRVLFVENFHRKQLSPVEEGRKFFRMHGEEGMSYREIMAELDLKTPAYVSRRIELLKLPAEMQAIVGTEDGPGVTVARNIAKSLDRPEEQMACWALMRDNELGLNEAVKHVRDGAGTSEEQLDVPAPRAPKAEEPQEPKLWNGDAEETAPAAPAAPKKPEAPTAHDEPRQRAGAKMSAADRDAAQRNNSSADRDAACQHLITEKKIVTRKQLDALYARTLLAPIQQGPARTRAHKWLREAGQAEFTIGDTDSYFEAVLSSGNATLVNRVTFVTALAAGEIRARDGRRQWDRTDAEHVRLLIEAGQYHPQTEWERDELAKFGVPFPGAHDDPDTPSINELES
ncbi:ParB/RepB/Spo0J family partition protein [Streptomyces sp. NPDC002812]|uniref:ParB/RepB/Spo0J family partition protein n=1 Tax=Streptomyces sp. NPDC002812 TaxID=3154434 RepID=UPI00332FC073